MESIRACDETLWHIYIYIYGDTLHISWKILDQQQMTSSSPYQDFRRFLSDL
jgi:hypothetical protein